MVVTLSTFAGHREQQHRLLLVLVLLLLTAAVPATVEQLSVVRLWHVACGMWGDMITSLSADPRLPPALLTSDSDPPAWLTRWVPTARAHSRGIHRAEELSTFNDRDKVCQTAKPPNHQTTKATQVRGVARHSYLLNTCAATSSKACG